MKKRKLLLIPILTLALLTGCGDSYHEAPSMDSESVNIPASSSKSILVADDASGIAPSAADSSSGSTGGDYSSTTISGDFADYSYNFSASGKTKKTKQEMLDYYESLQKLVDENGGYIENINNKYSGNVIDPRDKYITDSEIEYSATGSLSFTVEIPNDNIPLITASLEQFCRDNNFVVTAYNQTIMNYQGYQIVGSYDQDSYGSGNVITRQELDKTLKYASLRVNLNYYNPRPFITRMGLGLKQFWYDFTDGMGEAMMFFLAVAIGLILLFIEAIVFYKIWKRMIYRHRAKKPQYYPAKHIYVDNEKDNKDCLCDKCI
jgi:hypothetical protein